MRRLRFRALGDADVADITAWRYPPPWSGYDMDEEQAAAMRGSDAYRAILVDDALAGFFCTGEHARAPGVRYDGDALDLALFLRPELTGRGLGPRIVAAVLDELAATGPGAVRVTIAASNRRARAVVHALGFRRAGGHGFRHPYVVFVRRSHGGAGASDTAGGRRERAER